MKSDPENAHLKFSVRILIRHPTLDPGLVTEKLSLQPDRQLVAGEPFQSPNGGYLGAPNKMSSWSKRYDYHGTKRFFEAIGEFLDLFERERLFISDIHAGGGEVEIIFNLSGKDNIGDTLSCHMMERCVRLNVKVGIEVFPDR